MTSPSLKSPSFIKTFSGYVECVGSWGHGRAAAADFARMPAILLADDGDGHEFAYRCLPGRTLRQTAEALASTFCRDDKVVTFSFGRLSVEPAPHDFWIEESDEFKPNLAAYPDVIGY